MTLIQKSFFYLWCSCAALLIIITVSSLLYDSSLWFIQVLNFPRLQVLLALVVCLTGTAFNVLYRHQWNSLARVLLAGLVVAIGIQGYILLPYTPLAAQAVKEAENSDSNRQSAVSILLANVLITNRQSTDLLKIIASREPTFVLTMEVNSWWIEQLKPLHQRYPYRMEYPTDNAYGMALYSKLPLTNGKTRFLNHGKVPSFETTVTLPSGQLFQLIAVHPVAPVPGPYPTNIEDGEQEVALLKAGRLVARQTIPVLLAGDFNDVGWSHNTRQFATISGLNDVRVGRGLYSTFNARSLLWRWPLDYVFVSREFRLLAMEQLPAFGSDHLPYYVELTLAP